MGTWGHGNFEGDCELDYLGTLCHSIEEEVNCAAHDTGLDVHAFLYDVMRESR